MENVTSAWVFVCVCVDVEQEAGPARCLPSGAFIRQRAKWKWCPSSYCRHPLPSKKVGLGWVAARGSKRAQNDEESRSEMQEQPSMRAASSSLSWAVFSAAEPSRHRTNTAFPGRNYLYLNRLFRKMLNIHHTELLKCKYLLLLSLLKLGDLGSRASYTFSAAHSRFIHYWFIDKEIVTFTFSAVWKNIKTCKS